MCDRCQRGYHVECLGPFYPTEPEGEDDVWVSFVIFVTLMTLCWSSNDNTFMSRNSNFFLFFTSRCVVVVFSAKIVAGELLVM